VDILALRIVASLEADASALSSVASSQDSLHKQPKKKGIKSSIGRLFGKKEKGRMAHLAHRHVMVDPQGECSSVDFGYIENDFYFISQNDPTTNDHFQYTRESLL